MKTTKPSAIRYALLAALFAAVLASAGAARGESREGDPLPAFSLPDVDTGEAADPSIMLAGADAAIVFMQTSCAACRQELLALKDLQTRYPGFKAVAICVDSGAVARVKRYKEHFGFEFPFLHDPEFRTPALFGFSFTPGLVLVDRKGRIALVKGGFRQGDEAVLEQRLSELWGAHR